MRTLSQLRRLIKFNSALDQNGCFRESAALAPTLEEFGLRSPYVDSYPKNVLVLVSFRGRDENKLIMSVRRETPSLFQRPSVQSGVEAPLDGITPDLISETLIDPQASRFPSSLMAAFSVQIHQTLDAKKIALIAAHELRTILGCDRVCYLERTGNRYRLTAASDQPGITNRSRQAALLQRFVAAALPNDQRFVFPEDDLTLPDAISRPLAEYWESATGQLILVEPVFSALPNSESSSQKGEQRQVIGALVVEQFRSSELRRDAIKRLDWVMEHLIPALANARRYSRMATIPGLHLLGRFFEVIRRNQSIAILIYLFIIAGFLTGTYVIKCPFEVDCDGRLMPTERREVFAGFDGEIVDVPVNESDHVEAGQIVARLQSRDLEKALLEQTGALKGKLKARDAARAELRNRPASNGRNQSARDQAQLEVINADIDTIHKQLELLDQEQQQLVIRAPITGTITTDRPRERLLGRPVHRGESLIEIMDESGDWQLELAVPEKKIGHLLSFQQHASKIDVKFRLLSASQQSFDCNITRFADRTVASPEAGTCSFVFCEVSGVDLAARQIGSEVRARIRCGNRSLFFVWFHEFWELLQRHWWL